MSAILPRPLTVHCKSLVGVRAASTYGIDLQERNVVHLWFSTLAELVPRATALEALLDNEEIARADRFRFAPDRDRFVLGHGLLRSLIGRYLNVDGAALRIQRGPFGKPFLDDTELRFNLSDTKDALVLAVAWDHELGVDIETITRRADHEAVAHHYFTPDEVERIQVAGAGAGASDLAAKRYFLDLWTRKEAVLKASGVGIMEDLHALRVLDGHNELIIQQEDFLKYAAEVYHVQSLACGPEHLISVATERPMEVRLLSAALESPS
ncbi:MAG: 4'-phosphopantetheinyl transferase superfamily protein [Flavobacteriales bacterium]|nr:4'-phosphopantetheinyl transferase superfamily protein [Flavobacteriales bacterium]